MPAIPFIKKKIGQLYLVWFQNSNLYLQMEEPAWYVFRRTTQRTALETIASEFAFRYSVTNEESFTFVNEIRSEIQRMNQVDKKLDEVMVVSAELKEHVFKPYSNHHYQIGDQLLAFSYETKNFEYFLHPLIRHFETTVERDEMHFFELFAYHGQIVFRFNGAVKGIWIRDEAHLVKGHIFLYLINLIHGKTDADWLMTVHASALTNGKKTILFSAPPNHGKTTIAALLQDRGYQLISDDFVPIERNSLKAYPFPIAMSVKETSMQVVASLFPCLEQKPLNYITPEKSVRYLPPLNHSDYVYNIFPVHEYVFIHYNPSVDFIWEKLDPVKGLKLLLDQAWVTPNKGNAEILFERILPLSFYQLTYSNNQKALDILTQLFNNE